MSLEEAPTDIHIADNNLISIGCSNVVQVEFHCILRKAVPMARILTTPSSLAFMTPETTHSNSDVKNIFIVLIFTF